MFARSIPVDNTMTKSVQMGGRRKKRRGGQQKPEFEDEDDLMRRMEEGELSADRLAEEGRSPTPPPIVPIQMKRDPEPIMTVGDIKGGSRRRRRRNFTSRRSRRRSNTRSKRARRNKSRRRR